MLTPTDGAHVENVDIDLHAETIGLIVNGENATVDCLRVRTLGVDESRTNALIGQGDFSDVLLDDVPLTRIPTYSTQSGVA